MDDEIGHVYEEEAKRIPSDGLERVYQNMHWKQAGAVDASLLASGCT